MSFSGAHSRLLFEQVPFQRCSLTASYATCARLQAQRLLAQSPGALTDMVRVNTLILRAEAYEVCGYVPQSGIVLSLLSSGGRQSQLLLEAVANVANASVGAAHPARQTLRERALFFEDRGRVMAAQQRIADCQIDEGLEVTIGAALSRGGKTRAVTLAVHQAAIAAKVCSGQHDAVIKMCRELISSGIADAEVHEKLGDALLALERLQEALRAFDQAYRLIAEWQVLSSWRLYQKRQQVRAQVDAKRTGRQGGGRDGAGGGGERARAEQAADQTCSEHGLRGDDYTVLGVSRFSCSRKSLKSAFRKASLKYHPDKYTGTKECADMHFKRLSSAHDRLLTVCT